MSIDLPRVLQLMVKKNAADVFFHTGASISMKTPDGFVQFGDRLPPGMTDKVVRDNLPDEKIKVFDEMGEVDFSLSYKGIGRFRGNAFRQRGEVSLVLRRVNNTIPTVEELGVPQVVKELVMERNGLILVVGATGSGKTTTLAAMIDHRNSNVGGHILTLEDPIEFMHNHKKSIVAQREIGSDTKSFTSGMKSALREAPDVILLGEIRDLETMEFALKFANTGHLALTTLHANNTVTTLERMLAFFEKDSHEAQAKRIAQNLRAIICQRLAPREGGGKVAVVEVLINTPYVADLITKLDLGQLKDAIEKGGNYGMQSFDQHLVELYFHGVISEETAVEFADSKSNVKIKIRTEQAGKRIAQAQVRELDGLGGLSLTPKDSGSDL